MTISIIVEGKTEKVFLPHLRRYLGKHLPGSMPKLDPMPCNGRIYTGEKLRRAVEISLKTGADHVIALTDVYTGSIPPDFKDAADAKQKMREWVGNEPRFHPHAAQYDFEAWLLPYWPTITKLAGSNRSAPDDGDPEVVNHANPPAHRINEVFRTGSKRRKYVKTRDANRILKDNQLSTAISQCAELKALVNTILTICDAPPVS